MTTWIWYKCMLICWFSWVDLCMFLLWVLYPLNETWSERKRKQNLKQGWLQAFWKKIKNTQKVKKNTLQLDKTKQNVWIFVEILFFKATYDTKTINSFEEGREHKTACLFLLQTFNWQKIRELFVIVLYAALKKRIS